MSKFKNKILSTLAVIGIGAGMVSCDNNGIDSPYVKGPAKSTVLIYAVASNNLEYNLISDKKEILEAAEKIDLVNNNVIIYEVNNNFQPKLLQLVQLEDASYGYNILKEYEPEISSLEPSRFEDVLEDMQIYAEAEKYGLVLWSHGTGIDPYLPATTKSSPSGVASYSFGYDRDPSTGGHYEINVDALADLIPTGMFNYIWFDACYMSGIETIYEFRGKCDYIIGYPTEVFEMGVPYDLVLPYLARQNADLKYAAQTFFNYYAENSNPYAHVATIAVVDMSQIEEVADYCKNAYQNGIITDVKDIQKYSRGSIGPFYDFGTYTAKIVMMNDPSLLEEWYEIMDKFVVFKRCTNVDFDRQPINAAEYSGISVFPYNPDSDTAKNQYYRTLDWYKRVH